MYTGIFLTCSPLWFLLKMQYFRVDRYFGSSSFCRAPKRRQFPALYYTKTASTASQIGSKTMHTVLNTLSWRSSYFLSIFNIFSWFSSFDYVIRFGRVHLFRITFIAINCNEICVKRSLKSHLNVSSELSVHLLHKRRARNSDLHFKCKKPLYGSLYVQRRT